MSAAAEEVIVAGAKAMDAYWGGRYAPDEVEELRGEITAILEAVAPFMKAQALEEAASDFEDNIGITEFDEWARRDGARWAHIHDAWEYQGPYMDWLRARSAAVRGEG